MSEHDGDEVAHIETADIPEVIFPVEAEYARCVRELNRSGIVSLLPHTESLGVVGIDGKEYPIPTPEELQALFLRNKDLVERKVGQGLTQLQLTPFAIPTSLLVERARRAILAHAKAGKIFQTKQNPTDPDIPVRVDTEEPIWTWNTLKQALDTDAVAYFPKSYSNTNHQGKTKLEVMNDPAVCGVPGWSIGLTEPHVMLPQEGRGKTVGDRHQLENNASPHDYLKRFQSPAYQGETGWTPEDFLTNFITHLETTNQVSHDWNDHSALWLTGSWLPEAGYVPSGRWDRDDARVSLYAVSPGLRIENWGSRSTVRLGL
jgi:hypothetical protein